MVKTESKGRDRHYWQAVFKKWVASKLSGKEFCRQQEIPANRFFYWKKRLAVNNKPAVDKVFLPVEIKSVTEHMSPVVKPIKNDIEILISDIYTIRVQEDFSNETLKRVIKVLKETSC